MNQNSDISNSKTAKNNSGGTENNPRSKTSSDSDRPVPDWNKNQNNKHKNSHPKENTQKLKDPSTNGIRQVRSPNKL